MFLQKRVGQSPHHTEGNPFWGKALFKWGLKSYLAEQHFSLAGASLIPFVQTEGGVFLGVIFRCHTFHRCSQKFQTLSKFKRPTLSGIQRRASKFTDALLKGLDSILVNNSHSHFYFHYDQNWKKRQLLCVHTFTFMMSGAGKGANYFVTHFHFHDFTELVFKHITISCTDTDTPKYFGTSS